jgi:UDP-N-acetyl-2-amino-2-deoxyglucuronate dehydrogenase
LLVSWILLAMSSTLKFGIIGCGKIAERHAKLLSGGLVSGGQLGGVCDIDLERAKAFGARFGVKAYDDPDQMFSDERIDVFVVLCPSGVHAQMVCRLAKHGKPLVVEKPMALTLSDADMMIRACDEHSVRLFVVKQNRFNRPVVRLREAIEEGRFGKLVMGTIRLRWCRRQEYYDQSAWRGTWANDGGVLANQASHHVDLLEWMMGDIESVSAFGATQLVDIEAEDTAVATVKFRSGALGVIEATTATRPKDLEGSLSILGEKGSVVIGGFAANRLEVWNFEEKKPSDDSIFEIDGTNPQHECGYAHQAYYDHVVDCILHRKPQLVDGLEGRKSLELITAIYESIESGQTTNLRFRAKRCRLGIQ